MLLFPGRGKLLSVNSTVTFHFEFRSYIHTSLLLLHVTHISKHFEMCFLKKISYQLSFLNPLSKLCQLCVYMIILPCVSDETQGAQ